MQIVTDQLNRSIQVAQAPQRIISLVPSQTELLYDLGLREEVVGITKFCIHPELWFRSKTRIGGTKKYHFDRIAALKPDLIIGNKEENEQIQIEQLMQSYPVWMSAIYTFEDALQMVLQVGTLVNRATIAQTLVEQTRASFQQISKAEGQSVAYLIWRKPYMLAAKETFIDEMLHLCGFQNAFAAQRRYPTVSLDELEAAAPDCIFLSSEPYPFKTEHIAELQTVLPKTDIRLVDGEAFSWYGSRLLKSVSYFNELVQKVNLLS